MINGDDMVPVADAKVTTNMPASEYHADPCPAPSLSSSLAKILLRNPHKAYLAHPRLNPAWRPSHDEKFDIGTVAHAMLLEDGEPRIRVVDADDWRTKAAKEAREAARAAGQTPILVHQYVAAQEMANAAREFIGRSEISSAWAESTSEVTITWREGDVWLRVRLDRLTHDHRIAIDYKTTEDASPAAFGRTVPALGYPLQAALYARGVRALGGDDPAFVFLAQETEAPYCCALYGCDPGLRVIAEAQIDRAIDTWRACLATNQWPSYGDRIHWVDAPAWLAREHEEQQATHPR